jgi:VCBS repeat protein
VRGDFNRDGRPDLLGSTGSAFNVRLNNGAGTFGSRVITQAAWHTSLVPTDFSRDGRTDVAGCRFQNADSTSTPSELGIWLGNGPGTFSSPRRFTLPGSCRATATEDFNQDGRPDIAAIWVARNPDFSFVNGITVFFGDGAGNVSHSVTSDHISAASSDGNSCRFDGVVAGNYDRAGAPDVVVATTCDNDTFSQGTVLFGRGTGTGQFAFTNTDEAARHLQMAKDDVNQDSRLDLVVKHRSFGPHGAGGTGLSFYLNRDSGGIPTWEKRTVQSYDADGGCGSGVHAGVAVDLNNDAIKDAAYGEVLRPSDCSGTEAYRLSVKMGRADGAYGSAQRFSLPAFPQDVVSGDFDRDGRMDLAMATSSSLEVFLNRNSIATCTAQRCAP